MERGAGGAGEGNTADYKDSPILFSPAVERTHKMQRTGRGSCDNAAQCAAPHLGAPQLITALNPLFQGCRNKHNNMSGTMHLQNSTSCGTSTFYDNFSAAQLSHSSGLKTSEKTIPQPCQDVSGWLENQKCI